MKPVTRMIIGAVSLLIAGMTGYWFGTLTSQPMSAAPVADAGAKTERKVLYYRNPMGLPDTSQQPKKDAMGMDYVPVYEGDATDGSQISISIDKVQKLGVRSEAATPRVLDKTIRAAGRIEIDERRTYTIAPKFEGWVERLYVNTSGQAVGKGQPLFDVYSPELVSAQREYAIAAQGAASLDDADDDAKRSMQQLADASLARLKNWDISETQIRQLANGKTRRSLTFYAPVSGIVLEKKAVQGMRFMPGEMLYQIADLSTVWVVAEVAEQDIGQIRIGNRAQVMVDAYPERTFDGKVNFIYPALNSATRTVAVRIEISNSNGLLKPAMFASAMLPVGNAGKVLTVPVSAVIDSGTRQVVLVQLAQGRFEPRSVRLGARSENYAEVLDGLAEGEQVVTSANFLIDAESNLKAALGSLGGHDAHGIPPVKNTGQPESAKLPANDTGKQKSVTVGHQAQGTLDAVDNKAGSVTITHGPIKSLGWPGMTMDFALANPSLADSIKTGSAITFEIVERKPGEWVITKLQTAPQDHAQHQHEGH